MRKRFELDLNDPIACQLYQEELQDQDVADLQVFISLVLAREGVDQVDDADAHVADLSD